MNVEYWFPTPIWYGLIKEVDNNKLLEYVLSLEATEKGNVISNVGGWQSSSIPKTDKSLSDLFYKIEQKIGFIAQELKLIPKLKFANAWANINRKGDYNISHMHPMSYLSAVYYVSAPDPSSKIVFEDPRIARESVEAQNLYENLIPSTYFSCKYHPQVGKLIVFPSWLKHHVLPSTVDDPRISIAINFEIKHEST